MDVERIARAIDPEAWSPLYDHDVDGWWYDRRLDSKESAVRVQELLRDQLADAWDEGHAVGFEQRNRPTRIDLAGDRNPHRAALGVAEQPEGRVPE